LYDLEISPILGWTYGLWNTNVLKVETEPVILCFAYKWYGDKKIEVVYGEEIDIVKRLRDLLDEAEITVAHNAKGFDNKVSLGKILEYNLEPPSPFKTVDTLTVARSKFKFSSNSLDNLCQHLGLGEKSKVKHHDLWHDFLKGDKKAIKMMLDYCKQDVVLLDRLYAKELPYISNHPNVSTGYNCPKCGSNNIQYRGYRKTNTSTFRRIQCQSCGGWASERLREDSKPKYVNY
jgi:DNA-directed RNA polymerase subunit RPC12/RpoP